MSYTTVKQLLPKIQEEVPGIQIRDGAFGDPFSSTFVFQSFTRIDWMHVPDKSPEYINGYVREMVEQIKLRAIRDLGLWPRLEAYERDARQIQADNKLLISQLKHAQQRVGQLELELRKLKEGNDESSGD